MNTVQLGPGKVETSSVGFGCAQICRLPTKRQQHALLAKAYDLGIRHFDVARMYGLGAAEGSLADFILGRRNEVVIATKFGIPFRKGSRLLAPIQGLARLAIRGFPSLRNIARRNNKNIYASKDFSARFAESCFQQSLRELKTDYIDILLFHAPTVHDTIEQDVIGWIISLHQKGQIREFGISGEFVDVNALIVRFPELRRVTQFPSDILNRNVLQYRPVEGEGIVTFSGVSMVVERLKTHIATNPGLISSFPPPFNQLSEVVSGFANLAAHGSARMNPQGVTLISSTRVDRISGLVESVTVKPEFPDSVYRVLDDLANGYNQLGAT